MSPTAYATSCLNGISLWATKLFPLLFPFFVLTRLILVNTTNSNSRLDKYFNKLYHTPENSLMIFLLSFLCGYPMGAKLISTKYENNEIDSHAARKLLSFCSISGPMFMIGTVGMSFLNSYKAGIIILIANLIGSLINGLLYRNKDFSKSNQIKNESTTQTLTEIVYDSMISILMVGAFISLSFILIDILNNLKIISFISNTICSVLNIKEYQNVVNSVLAGMLEITRGTAEIGACDLSLNLKTIITSGLIGFGGISVIFQSFAFISKTKIKFKYILFQKLTQGILSLVVAIILTIIFHL